uniref:Uncharacterized protein n=1 Tax=Alexandrium catenella TaxID=2925 RepID=A0A7S1W388_ALECA
MPLFVKPPTDPLPPYETTVTLEDGTVETVWVDGIRGPLLYQVQEIRDTWGQWSAPDSFCRGLRSHMTARKPWKEMNPSEMELLIGLAAKKNRKLRELDQAQAENKEQRKLQQLEQAQAEQKQGRMGAILPPDVPEALSNEPKTDWNSVIKSIYRK